MPDPINVIVPAIVSLVVVGAGYFANRKLGISSGQLVLVKTLKDTVDAMAIRVTDLSVQFETCKTRLEAVEALKDDLEQTVDDLHAEIRAMRKAREVREAKR